MRKFYPYPMTATNALAKMFGEMMNCGNNIYRESFCYPINTYAVKNESDDVVGVVIEIALAGFEKDEIKVSITKDQEIKVAVEKKSTEPAKNVYPITNGISYKSSNVAFTCVVPIDTNKTKVSFNNGLLRIDVAFLADGNETKLMEIE